MQNTVLEGITSEQMSDLVVQGMLEKKALDISILDLREIKHAVADFFIICSGNSDTQIDAVSESVQQTVKKATGQFPWKKEGFQNKEWILVDYVDVVVHIFTTERRAFYGLEELWADAKITSIKE